ncbi:glycosyltransferase family 4 protein [Methylobacterium sp. J-088]|uniref:glycosyltransferase family 4 protein n=1 Tax=Methylobacterium sp. J-088 TaxID=2836664 RepID=UPI001FBAB4D5|nr:glycosyltransferase family 4 protein [Methylobacterium sp. J-088]MCJ2064895.1 glycosyltransferase family 4 protein [Methylobacterium sp. J-088]
MASPEGTELGGGIGTVSNLISTILKKQDPSITLTVINTRGSQWNRLWPINFLVGFSKLFLCCLLNRPSVLHLHVSERFSFLRKVLLLLLGRTFRVPTILHHHGAELITSYRSGNGAMKFLVRSTVRMAALNLVLGEVHREFLAHDLGVDRDRIVVLHNATGDRRLARPDRTAYVSGRFRLLFLANLIPRKGVGELLSALALLRSRGTDVPVILAGGGRIDHYRRESAELGIADLCTFTGWVSGDGLSSLLESADTLVLPSFHEGLPMSILEALSAGVPVIATEVGSIPEVLNSGVDSLLLKPGDVPSLAQAIETLVKDHALRGALATAGRALFERKFTQEAYARDLMTVYGRVLEKPRSV